MKKNWLRYVLIAVAVAIGILVFNTKEEPEETFFPRDYAEIEESGVLHAVTEYNTISYHVDKDTLQGFDYELLQDFASEKGLKIELTPEMSFEKRMQGVIQGRYDVLATGTVITTESKDTLLFTHPILLSKQVLVQRRKNGENDSLYINSQLDLAKKKLHVIKGSPALLRLHNLISEIADTIYIEEVGQYGPQQLLAMVSEGDIDYAVCDENIASSVIEQFPNLDLQTDIGFTQFYAWGVSKHSPALLDSLNTWLDSYKKSTDFKRLYNKYFDGQ